MMPRFVVRSWFFTRVWDGEQRRASAWRQPVTLQRRGGARAFVRSVRALWRWFFSGMVRRVRLSLPHHARWFVVPHARLARARAPPFRALPYLPHAAYAPSPSTTTLPPPSPTTTTHTPYLRFVVIGTFGLVKRFFITQFLPCVWQR